MVKEFKPTHIFHYMEGSNNKKKWPNGIPVMRGNTEDGLTEWLADDQGNIGGYSTEGDSWVVPLISDSEQLVKVLEKSSAQYHDGNHTSTEELKANLRARFGV